MTKNVTVSISDDLKKKMDNYPDVNWSAVARGCIEEYIKRREHGKK